MITKRALLEKINDLESRFQDEVPITGGNRFSTQEEFKAIFRMNQENELPETNKNIMKPYALWFEILQIANYFGSLVNIKTENIELLRWWEKIQQLAFIFGLVGVEVVGNKLRIWGITKYSISDTGDYYDLHGITWNNYLTMIGSNTPGSVNDFKGVKINAAKIFVLSANMNNANVWLTWVPFLESRDVLLERLDEVALSQMKTLNINGIAENSEEATRFVRALKKPKTFIMNYSFIDRDGKLNPNRLNVSTIDSKIGNLQDFINLVDWYNEYWYHILGKRYNNAYKKERNISGEVDSANANFDVLESFIFNQSLALLKWLEQQNNSFKAKIINYRFQDNPDQAQNRPNEEWNADDI